MKEASEFIPIVNDILKYEGFETQLPDSIVLMKIQGAIGKINRCRRFTPHDNVYYDIKYEDKIVPLTVAAIMKMGAEGEVTHSENNVNRQYGSDDDYPKSMLLDIVPLVK